MKVQFDRPPASAQQSEGVAVRYAAAKRNVPRWRWYLLLVLVIAPPLYFGVRLGLGVWWETAPGFVQVERTAVRAGNAGWVDWIAEAGQSVQAGQPLMGLRSQPAAPSGPLPAAVPEPPPPAAPDPQLAARRAAAQQAWELAQQQLALRRERLSVMQRLLEQGAATRGEVEAAQAQSLAAQADVLRARSDLDAAHERPAARAAGTSAAAPAEPLPPEPVMPAAPFDGEVAQVYVRPGEWVQRETDVMLLQSRQPPMVRAYVEPARARYAQVGRQATLRFFDGERVPAEVVSVGHEAARLPAERVAPLSPRSQSIVVTLRPLQPLPARYQIHQLPLDVRFDRVW